MIRILLVLAAMAGMTMPAQADYQRCGWRQRCDPNWNFSCQNVWVCRWVRTSPNAYHYYAAPRSGYYERERDHSVDHSPHCLGPVRREGLEVYNLDKAKESAEQMWMEAIRRHHGSKYMDLKNARRVLYDCSRASTGNRASERATEVVGRVLEQCTVEAIPCRGRPRDGGDGK